MSAYSKQAWQLEEGNEVLVRFRMIRGIQESESAIVEDVQIDGARVTILLNDGRTFCVAVDKTVEVYS